MAMASSSSAALLLAALRSSLMVWTVVGLAAGCISSNSSVMREAPLWNSCCSWRLAMAKMKGRTSWFAPTLWAAPGCGPAGLHGEVIIG